MRDKKRRRPSVIENAKAEEVDAPQVAAGDDEIAKIIETVLRSLPLALNREHLDIIGTVLRSSIETDPVSRVLSQRALRTGIASMRLPRALGAAAGRAGSVAVAKEIKK